MIYIKFVNNFLKWCKCGTSTSLHDPKNYGHAPKNIPKYATDYKQLVRFNILCEFFRFNLFI